MGEDLRDRKGRHLEVCLDPSSPIENGDTGLGSLRLPHASLHPVSPMSIDLRTGFLEHSLRLPVMISSMTGGTDEGRSLNRLLARCAGRKGLAMGTGSIRVLLDHPERKEDFLLRREAPDTAILANIGAAQVAAGRHREIAEAARAIGADGIGIHLNAAQELFQDGGDSDFGPWFDSILRFIDGCGLPVIVKETGAGIPPSDGIRLLEAGAAYVDIAGAGGTDWVAVESRSLDPVARSAAQSFFGWGYPTGELLLAYRQIGRAGGESGRMVNGRIIASGGLRTPRDFAVSLACGAEMTAAALPFIRRAADGGEDAVSDYIDSIEQGIRAAVSLTGSADLQDFRSVAVMAPENLMRQAETLAEEALAAEDTQ